MATDVQQTPFVKQLASSGTLCVSALKVVSTVRMFCVQDWFCWSSQLCRCLIPETMFV